MNLLVMLPMRPGMSKKIKTATVVLANRMSIYMMEKGHHVKFGFNDAPYAREGEENFFARFARLRNDMVDEYLKSTTTHVLWLDADIIDYPVDLVERLHHIAPVSIVSPAVLIEGTEQFYDTAGMRPSFEQRSTVDWPWGFDFGNVAVYMDVAEMYATGACALIPAEVHRSFRFEAQEGPADDTYWNTEFTSICEKARKFMGMKTWLASGIRVQHAHLPDYGEEWH